MVSLKKLQSYINMNNIPISWTYCYENAVKYFKKDWIFDFDFKEICKFYNLPDVFLRDLLKTIKLLENDDNLNFIFYLFYYILYFSNHSHDIWSWDNKNVFNNHGNNMISAISLLAGYPIHIKNMKERNYDEYQINMHKKNLYNIIMNDYNSINGIRFRHMIWLSIFIKCNIIEIGRLQYNYQPNKNISYLNKDKHHIELHIPGGKPLNIEEVKQSLIEAPKYIYKYFNLEFNKDLEYYCESWLLSPELKLFLNADSNILKFQKLFDILEYEENLKDFMLFVFNINGIPKSLSTLQEETSLQRNIKSYLLEGGNLHIGKAILR